MKFSNVLFFASAVLAAPTLDTRQDQTVVSTIFDSVKTLEDATQSNFGEINKAIQSVRDNVEAGVQAQVKTTLKANYDAILKALQAATNSIVSVTTGAAGGVGEAAKGLTQQQVDQLVEAVKAANRVIAQLQATITVTATDLTPDIKNAVTSEVDAVKGAIGPFVTPLSTFVSAARKVSAAAGVTVSGLGTAEAEFSKVVQDLVKSLGLPGLQLPGLGGLPSVKAAN